MWSWFDFRRSKRYRLHIFKLFGLDGFGLATIHFGFKLRWGFEEILLFIWPIAVLLSKPLPSLVVTTMVLDWTYDDTEYNSSLRTYRLLGSRVLFDMVSDLEVEEK